MVAGPIRRTNHTEPVPYFTMSTKARLRQGANRPPEGGPIHCQIYRVTCAKALPPIKAVTASAFTPTNGESDEPQSKKESCRYPQKMHRESGSKKN
jgi:hypothetical protein